MMKYTRNLFTVAALAAIFVFASCDNDDNKNNNGNQPSKEEAKAKISTFNSTAVDDVQDVADAVGLEAVLDLSELLDAGGPFGRTPSDRHQLKAFFRQKGAAFKKVFTAASGRTASSEPFDFEANLGVYAWDFEQEAFEKTDDADIIVIQFPTEGSATNNAQLELHSYAEVEVYDEASEGYVYEPSEMLAHLYKGAAKVASLLLEIDWDEAGFPVTADILVVVHPFKLDIVLDDTGARSSLFSVALMRQTEVLFETLVNVAYGDDSKSEESLETVTGYVQFRNLKLQGTINVQAANEAEVDWNEIADLALYSEGQKLGDIVFVDEHGSFEAYLQFADGSKEKLETLLAPVVDEIEELKDALGVNA